MHAIKCTWTFREWLVDIGISRSNVIVQIYDAYYFLRVCLRRNVVIVFFLLFLFFFSFFSLLSLFLRSVGIDATEKHERNLASEVKDYSRTRLFSIYKPWQLDSLSTTTTIVCATACSRTKRPLWRDACTRDPREILPRTFSSLFYGVCTFRVPSRERKIKNRMQRVTITGTRLGHTVPYMSAVETTLKLDENPTGINTSQYFSIFRFGTIFIGK